MEQEAQNLSRKTSKRHTVASGQFHEEKLSLGLVRGGDHTRFSHKDPHKGQEQSRESLSLPGLQMVLPHCSGTLTGIEIISHHSVCPAEAGSALCGE